MEALIGRSPPTCAWVMIHMIPTAFKSYSSSIRNSMLPRVSPAIREEINHFEPSPSSPNTHMIHRRRQALLPLTQTQHSHPNSDLVPSERARAIRPDIFPIPVPLETLSYFPPLRRRTNIGRQLTHSMRYSWKNHHLHHNNNHHHHSIL